MTGLAGKHVLVTGAGSGVGASIARRFSEAGAVVSLMGRRSAPLEAVADEIAGRAVSCDVTDHAAMKEAIVALPSIDIAIANAGAVTTMPFAKTTPEDFSQMLAVNLTGVFNLWHLAFAGMKARGWGRLIAVASTAGLKGYPYVSGYVAAKHGVVGLTRALAIEAGTSGVTVNALCPGFVDTPLLERSIATIMEKTGMTAEAATSELTKGNPQQRLIDPDEVAGAALYLCSDAARSVNGHCLTLSGGEI